MIPNSELGTKNSKLKILLIMSSPEELRPFLRTVRHRRTSFQGAKAWNFQDRSFTGLAFLAGMGGAAPRILTARAIAAYPPDVVIVAGFGGALTSLPPATGVLIASECWRLAPAEKPDPADRFFSPGAPRGFRVSASVSWSAGFYRSFSNHPGGDRQSHFAEPGLSPAPTGVGPGNGRSCHRHPSSSPALSGDPGHH